MTQQQNLDAAFRFAEENPYTGTTQQIVSLSVGIAEISNRFDRTTFALFRDKTEIEPKIFSKLKVIGQTLLEIDEAKRREVIKQLPASYSAIHVLCSLKPEELVTAAKSKVITPSLSVRAAREYVQQVKFPALAATDGEKGRWGHKQEHLYAIFRPEDVAIEGEALQSLEKALRRVCKDYGVVLHHAKGSATTTLRKQERAAKERFWKSVLQKALTQKWFNKTPDLTKKQFNIRSVQELHETPLRSFTGFIIKSVGGRDVFWDKHGEAYVAKLHLLMEQTEDAAQRYNYRRRVDEVLGARRNLAIWRNVMLKESGFSL